MTLAPHGPGLEFRRPITLAEVFTVLAAAPDDSMLLAGGMTAMPYLNRGEWHTSCIVSLRAVREMRGLRVTADRLVIGANMTHTELTTDAQVRMHCPVLAESAAAVGDLHVRNRGTIGGTVAFANAGADHVTTLTALGADVVLARSDGARRVAMCDFVTGRRATVRQPHEIITAVEIPLDTSRTAAYLRLTRVQGASPVLTAAATSTRAGQTLCIGGATARPLLMIDQDLTSLADDEIRRRVKTAITEPIGDAWSPAEYRHAMAAEYAVRTLAVLRSSLQADAGPAREEQSC